MGVEKSVSASALLSLWYKSALASDFRPFSPSILDGLLSLSLFGGKLKDCGH